jgi:hypothetical protein
LHRNQKLNKRGKFKIAVKSETEQAREMGTGCVAQRPAPVRSSIGGILPLGKERQHLLFAHQMHATTSGLIGLLGGIAHDPNLQFEDGRPRPQRMQDKLTKYADERKLEKKR